MTVQETEPSPTHCQRCAASLERGAVSTYEGAKRVETICQTCADADDIVAYVNTGVLTTNVVSLASRDAYRFASGSTSTWHRAVVDKIMKSTGRIQAEINKWEETVWFGGLQAEVRAADHRGFRLRFPLHGFNVISFAMGNALVYSIAGRTQITIESDDETRQVTLITDETTAQRVMGQNSIRATEEQAIELLAASLAAVKFGVKFKRDDKVGLGL